MGQRHRSTPGKTCADPPTSAPSGHAGRTTRRRRPPVPERRPAGSPSRAVQWHRAVRLPGGGDRLRPGSLPRGNAAQTTMGHRRGTGRGCGSGRDGATRANVFSIAPRADSGDKWTTGIRGVDQPGHRRIVSRKRPGGPAGLNSRRDPQRRPQPLTVASTELAPVCAGQLRSRGVVEHPERCGVRDNVLGRVGRQDRGEHRHLGARREKERRTHFS